jgi:hypothetical protein
MVIVMFRQYVVSNSGTVLTSGMVLISAVDRSGGARLCVARVVDRWSAGEHGEEALRHQ